MLIKIDALAGVPLHSLTAMRRDCFGAGAVPPRHLRKNRLGLVFLIARTGGCVEVGAHFP
jgi:hypothetical protein